MNSALKPVLTSSTPQNPPVTSQLNKPMHPQGTPSNYGQPSTHMPQSLVNLPHNPTVAHTHPNPAHQTNHYSLNVPNAPQHYTPNNPSTIPASNHPIPNASQGNVGGQTTYSPNKNIPFAGGYQPNLGHPPNQNPVPPVSQSLPATQPSHHASPPAAASPDKPHSNGTAEIKSPTKPEPQENHVSLPKDKSPLPPTSPKMCERPEEKPASTALPEQKQDSNKEEAKTSITEMVPVNSSPSVETTNVMPSTENKEAVPEATNDTQPTTDMEVEGSESNSRESEQEVVDNAQSADGSSPNKLKEKEQQKTTPASKAATPKTPTRKSKTPKSDGESPKTSKIDAKTPAQKSPTVGGKSKRTRTKTQPYQSPLPEIEIITKISSSNPRSKTNDDKLIVFYKNEFLAVRNSEGSFYICQAVQNIYKSSPKIRIRWLSQDKTEKSGEIYTPDFYDNTDFDCILTNLNLVRVDKGRYRLPPAEKERTDSILKRSLAVEKGEVTSPSLTEEHPDGIDLSLYKEESQLKKRRSTKRRAASALRASKKSNNTTKSPDQPKVRKVATRTTKKAASKKAASSAKTKRTTSVEARKPIATTIASTTTTRMDRAKRRSDNQNHNKVSPVVDQKKARVLAKVARKGAVNTKSQSGAKNTKAPKATPSSSKVQKSASKTVTKKTKRSSRK